MADEAKTTRQARMLALLRDRKSWVSRADIVTATGFASRSVGTAASELRAKGFRVVGRNPRHGGGYRLLADG